MAKLVSQMSAQWDCEKFFAGFLKIYGTASSSIERALKNDRAVNVACEEINDRLERPDAAVANRVYFRFLKHDADVRGSLDEVKALKEFNNPKARLQYIICCSSQMISVYDAVADDTDSFALQELPSNYRIFLPLTGSFQRISVKESGEADAKACRKLTNLLDALIRFNHIDGTQAHEVHEFIRRVLFCLFAEDTGIFAKNQFSEAFGRLTDKEGSNAVQFFTDLFEVLNCPEAERGQIKRPLAAEITAFPYVNGGLFEEDIYVPAFNVSTRSQLLDCGELRWHEISPSIFGAMFQNALDPKLRRTIGAHYTSEENILKLINPLFMDDLRAEFADLKAMADKTDKEHSARRKKLMQFQNKLAALKFLDPACGCGNFLIIAITVLLSIRTERLLNLISCPTASQQF